MGFGTNMVVVILISLTAIASGFGGFKNAKPSCVAGGTLFISGFWSCVNLESRKAKRRLYIPDGLLVGDPDNSSFMQKHIFSPNQREFLQKSCDEFPCSSKQGLTPQPPVGSWSSLCPSRLDETRDCTANLLQILLFFITHRGIWYWWLHWTNLSIKSSSRNSFLQFLMCFPLCSFVVRPGNMGVTGCSALVCVKLQLTEVATSLKEIIWGFLRASWQ